MSIGDRKETLAVDKILPLITGYLTDEGFSFETSRIFLDSLISSPTFGKNLNLAEAVFRLIHDKAPHSIGKSNKEDYLNKILSKAQAFAGEYTYSEEYFSTVKAPIATQKFIFHMSTYAAIRENNTENPPNTDDCREAIKCWSRPMQKYALDQFIKLGWVKVEKNIKPDAKKNDFGSFWAPESDIQEDFLDLIGRRKPEKPLLLIEGDSGHDPSDEHPSFF